MTAYRWLFDHVLVKVDAEKAHHLGFAGLKLGRPVLAGLGKVGTPARRGLDQRRPRWLRSERSERLETSGLDKLDQRRPRWLRSERSERLETSGFDRLNQRGGFDRLNQRGGFDRLNQRGGLDKLEQPKADHPGVSAMGIDFPGVLGVAAGFDKNAEGIDALAALGFGFVEVGTVTGEPQPGNPKPRLFRLPDDRAVVNRMGFNNDGAEVVAERLARRRLSRPKSPVVVGINIGKTKVVPEDDVDAVIADYEKSTRLLAPYADYLVVNVSSPNTPGLRDLQSTERLRPLLEAVRQEADRVSRQRVPLLVKIAPDLSDEDVLAVADLAVELGLDGIVATNTTINRDGLASTPDQVAAVGAGGLSGAPLKERALEVLTLLRERVGPEMTLIGVGGISSAADAQERLDAGATLLQAYSAFIYEGPTWPSRVQRELARR